ncbi:hypothetical protein GQ44DRAFT_778631 [Phaeosphaeriaceae sp. PMI808]|nr:hypothetical protein GQ44DRAFT_778631 [Phaeosphaeriaceae sp. PMI808]
MMRTTQTEAFSKGIEGGVSAGVGVFNGEVKIPIQTTVKKEVTHVVEITGDNPFDGWGNYDTASWSLKENKAHDEEFCLVPRIKARPNFRTELGSLFSSRTPDDPVVLDPEYEPWYDDDLLLAGQKEIDRWNLGAENLDDLWDCTFYHEFGQAVKESKTAIDSNEEVSQVKTVTKNKVLSN